ncbi:MAG: hypothetical protein K2X08_02210, partial [Chlamydiales bacterium]|nr:hypothetical protein [Chlamydiales bacterium]
MTCQRFFLLLTLIPALMYSLSEQKCISIHNQISFEWNRYIELIEQFNQLEPHEKKKELPLLRDGMECCQRAYQDCQRILNDIVNKSKQSKLKRDKFWRIRMKSLCEQNKEQIKNAINQIQILVRQAELRLLAWEKEINAEKEDWQEPLSQPEETISLFEQKVDDHLVSPFQLKVTEWKEDVRAEHKSWMSLVADSIDIINGSFSIDEIDLVLSEFSSLAVRRNYSSQNPLTGNLGYGWKLSINPFLIEQDEKKIAAEADGTVIIYSFNSKNQRWEVSPEDNPNLYNVRGQGGGNGNPFHSYIENDVLYGVDGSIRFFEGGLLQKWVDAQGNTLIFFYENKRLLHIENDQGDFCDFYYDFKNNISEIYAKEGRKVSYEYNPQGDLVKVSRPNLGTVIYEYDEFHRVIREIKPYGKVLENIYDDKGRVKEQKASRGVQSEMMSTVTFDYTDGMTSVIDAAGDKTIYKIFQNQIYKVIDSLGRSVLQSWFIDERSWFDPEKEEICEWDQEGGAIRSLKTTVDNWKFFYKEGCLVEAIDPMDRTHIYVYDSCGRLIQDDVDEWHRSYVYDARGLLVLAEQKKNNSTSWLSSWVWASNDHSKIERSYRSEER